MKLVPIEAESVLARLGACFVGDHNCGDLIRYSEAAEKNNYESAWIAEDFGMRDAIGPIASIAISTKRIKLATGILPIYYRTPALMAMTIATLDELSGGRMVLGLGNGIREWILQQGLGYGEPIQAMKEYIQIIRGVLKQGEIGYNGQIYKFPSIKLHFRLTRRMIPIYIATRGPRMMQLAGEIGDGALVSEEFCTPEFIKWARRNLNIGAKKSGRNPHEVDLAAYILVAISNDREAAVRMIKPRVVGMLSDGAQHASLPIHLERMGLSADDVLPTVQLWRNGDKPEACDMLPDSVLGAVSVYGTPSECATKMSKLRAAGLDLPVVCPVGTDVLGTLELAKEL